MGVTVFARGSDSQGTNLSYMGESVFETPLFAVLDVEARESGDSPSAGDEYALLSDDSKELTLFRVITAPEGERV
jgi:hypothetical protein